MFKKFQSNKIGVDPIYAMPADDLTYHVGDALVLSSGHLVKATGTTAPEYFCVEETVIGTDGDPLQCVPVEKGAVYETTVNSGTVAVGSKYTIHTDAAQITSTTTSGVAEVVGIDGARIFVKF
jgi:hypothetical protein